MCPRDCHKIQMALIIDQSILGLAQRIQRISCARGGSFFPLQKDICQNGFACLVCFDARSLLRHRILGCGKGNFCKIRPLLEISP